MKYLVLIIAFVTAPGGWANATDARNATDTRYESLVSTLLGELRAVTHIPAFSVAAVHKGKLVAAVASGTVNTVTGEAARPDHLFRLASVSKIVGATMLAELAADGRLDVDAPLGRYFPELDKKYHQITVRQLMAHTSGMPHYQAIDLLIDSRHYDSALEAVSTLKGRSLLAPPGAQYHYSSHGYTLAGAVYEKVTGLPLEESLPDFVQRYSGRQSPKIEDVTKRNPMRSGLFERSGTRMHPTKFNDKSYSVFGAGLTATAPDLAFFGDAVLRRAKENAALADLLFTPQRTSGGERTGRPLFEVAFGWRVGRDGAGRTVYHHAGVTPGARSVIVLYPEEELTLVFLSNSSWVAQIERTAFALAGLYLEGGERQTAARAVNFEGTYGDEAITGQLVCQSSKCTLDDGEGALSQKTGRFNPTPIDWKAWPLVPYRGKRADHLIMVSKIGFIDFISDRARTSFTAGVGQNGHVTLSLESTGEAAR